MSLTDLAIIAANVGVIVAAATFLTIRFDKLGARIDADLRKHIDTRFSDQRTYIDVRFDDLNDRFEEHRQHFDARFEDHRQHIDGRFDDFNLRFADQRKHIDDRFAHIDDRFAHIDDRFAHIDDRFTHVEARLDKMDDRLDDMRKHFDTRLDAIWPHLLEMRNDVSNIAGLLEGMELRVRTRRREAEIPSQTSAAGGTGMAP